MTTTEKVKTIGERYLTNGKTTGWEIDSITGAIIVYAIDAIFYEGEYYSITTGERISLSKDNYIKDLRNNMQDGHKHDAIQGTGTGVIVHRFKENQLEFLLQLRSDVNQYGLLGGGLELGDTYERCAIKELVQEAALLTNEQSLHLENVYAGPKHITKYASGDLVYHTIIVYSICWEDCIELSTKLDAETKELKWVSKEELINLLKNQPERFFPNNYPILWDVVTKIFN